MCFKSIKNDRIPKVSFITVSTKDNPDRFLTIVASQKQAGEYINSLLQLEYWEHFNAWCKIRDYEPSKLGNWVRYVKTCLTKEDRDKYIVNKVTYKLDTVATNMRLLSGCVPVGCSFEEKRELDQYNAMMANQKLARMIDDELKKYMQENGMSMDEIEGKTTEEMINDLCNDLAKNPDDDDMGGVGGQA